MRERINQAVVSEIARLLDPRSRARIQGRALGGGDIAVLVRERDEGEALRSCLRAAGIEAVTIGRDKVFDSEEASGLLELLRGIAAPNDELIRNPHRMPASPSAPQSSSAIHPITAPRAAGRRCFVGCRRSVGASRNSFST